MKIAKFSSTGVYSRVWKENGQVTGDRMSVRLFLYKYKAQYSILNFMMTNETLLITVMPMVVGSKTLVPSLV